MCLERKMCMLVSYEYCQMLWQSRKCNIRVIGLKKFVMVHTRTPPLWSGSVWRSTPRSQGGGLEQTINRSKIFLRKLCFWHRDIQVPSVLGPRAVDLNSGCASEWPETLNNIETQSCKGLSCIARDEDHCPGHCGVVSGGKNPRVAATNHQS